MVEPRYSPLLQRIARDVEVVRDKDDGRPLLVRYRLLFTPWWRVYVHHFVESDSGRDVHSHPWNFLTLILRGGYLETVPIERYRRRILAGKWPPHWPTPPLEQHFRRPGSLLWRPHRWVHRVDLRDGREAWTLIVVSAKKGREWGFLTPEGYVPWQDYVAG